jgi:hypothetical protein
MGTVNLQAAVIAPKMLLWGSAMGAFTNRATLHECR